MIEIDDLTYGGYYRGYCPGGRGPHVMRWAGTEFQYMRCKFGGWFVDTMQHENDPNRHERIEGFIPLERIEGV